MAIKVGDRLPSVGFKRLTADGLKDIRADEVFEGKRVALFGLPGAYTPVCSARHLPGFVEHADALKAKGFDIVACVSVNDPFVMAAWGKDQNVGDKVLLLADGNGEFTRAVGLTLDGSGFGLGERSQRYSMIVEDGVVKALNLDADPLTLEKSSAEALLAQV